MAMLKMFRVFRAFSPNRSELSLTDVAQVMDLPMFCSMTISSGPMGGAPVPSMTIALRRMRRA